MVPSGASAAPSKFMPHWPGPDASTQRPAIGSGGAPGRTIVVPVTACSPAQPASAKLASAMMADERTIEASLHCRDDELGAFFGAGWPARCHGLGLGIEAHRIRPMLVEVAKTRALPAAKRVIGQRNGDREVHADHADLHAAGKIACGVAIAREDRNAVAVFVLGGKPHGFFVVLRAHHREHRPKNLFLVDTHVRLHVVEQAAAHEIAVLIALELEVTPI